MVLSVPSIATEEEIRTENCVHGSSQYIYKAGQKDVSTMWRARPFPLVDVWLSSAVVLYVSHLAG